MTILHIDVLALASAPGVEVDRWEPRVLAYEIPRGEDACREILQMASVRAPMHEATLRSL